MQLDCDNAKDRRKTAVVGEEIHAFGCNSRCANAWRRANGFVQLRINQAVLVKIPGVHRDLVANLSRAVELGKRWVARCKCFQNLQLKSAVE